MCFSSQYSYGGCLFILVRFLSYGVEYLQNVGTGEAAEWWNRAVVCGCWGLTSMLRVIWWCAESRDLLTLGEGMKSL